MIIMLLDRWYLNSRVTGLGNDTERPFVSLNTEVIIDPTRTMMIPQHSLKYEVLCVQETHTTICVKSVILLSNYTCVYLYDIRVFIVNLQAVNFFLSICNVHFHIYLHLSMVVIWRSFVYTWFENYQFLLIHGKYTHNIKIEYETYILYIIIFVYGNRLY